MTQESSIVTDQLTTPLDPKSADYEERVEWLGARILDPATRRYYKGLQVDIISGRELGDDVDAEVDKRHTLLETVRKMKSESKDPNEQDPFYGRNHKSGIE
jgi:hypothetical protein